MADGRQVRLAQVDAPERNECFGSQSTAGLADLTAGRTVVLRRPADGPERDRYGRTLADVSVGGVSVNELLVRDGAAEWYEEFAAEDADLARRLQAAENEARAAGRGLWSTCSASGGRAMTPTQPPSTVAAAHPLVGADCDPAYPDICLPTSASDRNCGAIPHRRFRVLDPDPHHLDGDGDGIGCETD